MDVFSHCDWSGFSGASVELRIFSATERTQG